MSLTGFRRPRADYGLARRGVMSAVDVLSTATSGNAKIFGLADRGQVRPGLLADLVVIEGDPTNDASVVQAVRLVIKGGEIVEDKSR